MIPQERELVARLKDKPFTLLGINSDRDRSALPKQFEKNHVTWPNIVEGSEREVSKRWNVSSYPTIYVLDHEGVIRKKGYLTGDQLEKTVDELLAKVRK